MKLTKVKGYIFFSSKYADMALLKDSKYIQYGKKKNKFLILLASKSSSPPQIFNQRHWKIKYNFWRFRLGETTRPLKIGQIMEAAHETLRKRGQICIQRECLVRADAELWRGRSLL